jgi:hypothetical protein
MRTPLLLLLAACGHDTTEEEAIHGGDTDTTGDTAPPLATIDPANAIGSPSVDPNVPIVPRLAARGTVPVGATVGLPTVDGLLARPERPLRPEGHGSRGPFGRSAAQPTHSS